MITVIYSTRKNKPDFINFIKNTSGIKDIEIIQYINNGEYYLRTGEVEEDEKGSCHLVFKLKT